MDPLALAERAGIIFMTAGQPLAAAIVFGEAVKLAPDHPGLLYAFGAAVGSSAGVLVEAPFVHWSTRILARCLASKPPAATVAGVHGWLAEHRKRACYVDLPPIETTDLEPLLDYLDLEPGKLLPGAVSAAPPSDQMFLIMALGELRAARVWPAVAAAITQTWSADCAMAALKRVRPWAAVQPVRDAIAAARARPDAEELEPYLATAERAVSGIAVSEHPTAGPRRVEPPSAIVPGSSAAKPWWKVW